MEKGLCMAVKANSPKWTFFVIFFVLGCILGCTQLFAPLHEMAHVSVARNHGVYAYVSGWAHTNMAILDRPAILAGWISQVITFGALALIFAMLGSSSIRMSGAFWYAVSMVHWIRAFGSSDFTTTLARSFDGNMLAFYQYHAVLMKQWMIWGVLVYGMMGVFILMLTAAKRNPEVSPGAKSN